MSSSCPPQLHLSLPANTTSFKRSFEQFGFDLESPGGTEGAGSSGSDGNDRSKRARSASRFSDDTDSSGSSQSSTIASGSSISLSGNESETDVQVALSATRTPDGHGAPHFSLPLTRSSQEPPRLPTPEIQDIEMVDYSSAEPVQSGSHSAAAAIGGSSGSQTDESYRLSLERFNAFDTQISALRRSHSPAIARSTASPPVLPPLELLGDESRLNTSTIPFMHPPTQSSPPPLPEALYSFGLPLLNRTQRPGSNPSSREDPRILPHETHSQAESSTSVGAQRQPAPRFSNSPRPTSQHSSPTPRDEPQPSTLPFIQFSPNSLWTRYDESPSPTSDDQEFEFTEFRGSEFAPALELRSSSPLFNELEDDDDFQSVGRPVEPNPPTLPPIDNVWDDPLEDLIGYPSTSRAGSSGAQAESLASSSRSGTQTQPALDRISTRNLVSLRDTEIRSASSSDGDRDHSLPSPFLPNIGGWMEGENNAPFGLPPDWLPSSTRQNTNNSPLPRDTTGPSRSSTGVDLSWSSSRANPSTNSVHPRLLSRNSSVAGSRSTGVSPATRAMLTSDYRTQASSSASSLEQEVSVPRRLRFSGTQLGTPLEAQMEPWLSERARDSSSPEPDSRNEGLTPEERISHQLEAIVAATRRTARQFRNYAGSSTYQAHLDNLEAMGTGARRRRSTSRAVSPPPRISTDTDSLVGPPFPSGPSHTYESLSHSWTEPGRHIPSYAAPAPSLSQLDTFSARPGPEQPSSRPDWSWVDNTTVEVQHEPPSPPEPVSSTVTASELLRMHSRLYNTAHNPSQPASAASPPRRPSRSELITGLHTQPRPPSFSSERRVGPLFDPNRPPMNYSTLRRRGSSPVARPLLFVRPQIYAHQSARGQDHPNRQRTTPSWSASGAHSSMTESSDSLLEHAMEMESDAVRSSGANIPRRSWTPPTQPGPEPQQPQAEPRAHFPPMQRRQSVYQHEWLNLSDEEIARPGNHRNTHGLTGLRRDTTQAPTIFDTQRRQQTHDVPPRRPESANTADFVYLDVPSLPSPGLGEIFQHSEPANNVTDRVYRSSPSNDARSAPRSLVGTQLNQGHHATTTFAPYPDARGPYYPVSFSARRRSPSPMLDEQSNHHSPPPRTGPSADASSANRASMNIDPSSFAPGPFRNTLERFININMAREGRTGPPPPSIPPLSFESNTSRATSRPMPSMRVDPPPQLSHPIFWPPPQNNASQTSLPHSEDSPSSDAEEEWSWHQRLHPRSQPGTLPRRAASLRSIRTTDGLHRQAPVDMHNYLTQRVRMEASRIESPGASQPSQGQPTRGEVEGFSNAVDVLRQDGLSAARSRQLIARFHLNRSRANAEPRNSAPPERLSSWGIIDHANSSPPDPRTSASGGSNRSESETWSTRSVREIAADVLGERYRNPPLASSDSDRERVVQGRRRIRFARQNEMGAIFGPSGMMQEYAGRFGRRGRALGDYMRDEDFDESYESLLSLAATLGEVKPRATPDEVIAGMDTGLYKDWKTPDSDHRCPICLDDYQPDDALLKLTDCSHWLHRECLQQWLKGASTCPVCREVVTTTTTCRAHRNHSSSNEPGPSRRRDPPGNGPSGSGGSGTFGARGADNGGDWLPPWRYTPAP